MAGGDDRAEPARRILDPASEVLGPWTLGRAVNFAFGAGDRADGLYDAGTRKRLAVVRSEYDPASLFGGSYDVTS
ncbi:hypothetical protein [Streptomyces sp. DSM 40750]|uniref:hypothetical protein n=1 Tax=Streptomyces sp. DSM 40750 TaxID=2801030 RepID=UPI00214B9A12|nr:hypothetical protein [Streptomyces sp. DSM 40750]UUU22118.1 hypothetical protein JIX55_18385 [Streptomyces sp. DSM 40750]